MTVNNISRKKSSTRKHDESSLSAVLRRNSVFVSNLLVTGDKNAKENKIRIFLAYL